MQQDNGVGHPLVLTDRITRTKSFKIVNLQIMDAYRTHQKMLIKRAQQVSAAVVLYLINLNLAFEFVT